MSYLVLRSGYEEGFCSLGALENVPHDEQILAGQPRADDFPQGAFYEMRHEFPKDIHVPDSVHALIHFVVSPRLAQALDAELGKSLVEFLPVKIKNHKGRFARGIFFVLNPLDVIDCIDLQASGVRWNAIDPTQIASVDRLVLRPVPEEVVIFRPLHFTRLILVREDVAARLLALGLEGLRFVSTDGFRG